MERKKLYKKMVTDGGNSISPEEGKLIDWFFDRLRNLLNEAVVYFGAMDLMAMLIIESKCFGADYSYLDNEQVIGFLNECVNKYSPNSNDLKKRYEELEKL